MSTRPLSFAVPTALVALGLAAFSLPAAAQGLDGTPVTGSLIFSGSSDNVFTPDTAVISESQTEFLATEHVNKYMTLNSADFTADQLVLTYMISTDAGAGKAASTYTFTDPAFKSVTKLSDTFLSSLTYSLVGDTLTIDSPAFFFNSSPGSVNTVTATFHVDSVSPAAVPEASSTVSLGLLLMLGLAGLTLARRKKPTGAE